MILIPQNKRTRIQKLQNTVNVVRYRIKTANNPSAEEGCSHKIMITKQTSFLRSSTYKAQFKVTCIQRTTLCLVLFHIPYAYFIFFLRKLDSIPQPYSCLHFLRFNPLQLFKSCLFLLTERRGSISSEVKYLQNYRWYECCFQCVSLKKQLYTTHISRSREH